MFIRPVFLKNVCIWSIVLDAGDNGNGRTQVPGHQSLQVREGPWTVTLSHHLGQCAVPHSLAVLGEGSKHVARAPTCRVAFASSFILLSLCFLLYKVGLNLLCSEGSCQDHMRALLCGKSFRRQETSGKQRDSEGPSEQPFFWQSFHQVSSQRASRLGCTQGA